MRIITSLIVFFSVSTTLGQFLTINEVVSSNQSGYQDNNGEYSDWIEIYNATNNPVNLNGYYLTDNLNNPTKFQIPAGITIQANGYLVFFASGNPANGLYHTNFSLSSSGEEVGLYSIAEIEIDAVTVPFLWGTTSYARTPDGLGNFKVCTTPTPGVQNAGDFFEGILTPPTFSAEGGFYPGNLNLTLTTSEPGATIVYSIDGSDPTTSNLTGTNFQYKDAYRQFPGSADGTLQNDQYISYSYAGPIPIADRTSEPNKISARGSTWKENPNEFAPTGNVNKGTIIKAKVSKAGYLSSPIISHTYFVNNTGENPYGVPVVSIGINPKDFYGYTDGLNVAGQIFDDWRNGDGTSNAGPETPTNYWQNWEKQATFQYFNTKGEPTINCYTGMEISGKYSQAFAVKSYQIKFKASLGQNDVNYPIFKNQTEDAFDRITLRSGGTDSDHLIYRDLLSNKLASNMKTRYTDGDIAILYINGEYFGIRNIREKLNENNFKLKHEISESELDFTNYQVVPPNAGTIVGDFTALNDLEALLNSANMSLQSSYDLVNSKIDVDNFIDYIITQVFIGNDDWPSNNHRYFRNKINYDPSQPAFRDGRYNWLLFDTDFAWGLPVEGQGPESSQNSFTLLGNDNCNGICWPTSARSTLIFRKLTENPYFMSKFLNRFADMMNTNYSQSHLLSVFTEIDSKYQTLVGQHFARYGTYNTNSNWQTNRNILLNDWFPNRENTVRQQLIDKFPSQTGGNRTLIVDVSNESHGYVHLNTIDLLNSTAGIAQTVYPWTGTYFRETPVTLIAKPKAGYVFSHWETPFNASYSTSDSIVAFVSGTPPNLYTIKAVFIPSPSYNYEIIPYDLSECDYSINMWSPSEDTAAAPESAKFVKMNEKDPILQSTITGYTNGPFNYSQDTRINGLAQDGIAFKNTSDNNIGYPKGRLGGMIVALNTEGVTDVNVRWKAKMVNAGTKSYAIRLQYRIGGVGQFIDVSNSLNTIEFKSDATGSEQQFTDIALPTACQGQKYVELFWRYYCLNDGTGERDQIAIDDIKIWSNSNSDQSNGNQLISQTINNLTVTGTYNSYQWYNCETNVQVIGANTNTLSAPNYGLFYVELIDANGCNKTSDCYALGYNAINNLAEDDKLYIYPNPTNGIITVEGIENFDLHIYDVRGILVKEFLNSTSTTFDLKDLSRGIYNLEFKSEGKYRKSKLIKID